MTVETFSNWCKRNEYVLWYKQEPLYLKNGEDYSTDTLIKKWQSELSAATPPDVEQLWDKEKTNIIDNGERAMVWNGHVWVVYIRQDVAGQSAVQDATPQEGSKK